MKMMGKRVNYAGRSVISPDPYISTDQIGVPEFIARTLTFPESVRNLEKLKQMVINGAYKYPGANFVEYPNGEKKALQHMTLVERRAEAALLGSGGKTVYRHLETGDPLLVNRQPTLHKPSIMAHIARVLPKEQTIRMHYSNCKSYNADFDGDEMNIHLPQNYTAIAEAYELAATHKQYIVPTSGAPIRGLIQDFIVSSVFLTSKDSFFSKEEYNQLVFSSLNEFLQDKVITKIHLERPCIFRSPNGPLWTGKQVVTTILKNLSFDEREYHESGKPKSLKMGLNLTSKARLDGSNWGALGKDEGQVVIRNNELLQGVLDKNQLGDSKFGMIHSFYELYGSERAGQLLTALGRLLVAHLQYHGFTCGLDDGLLSKESNKQRDRILKKAHKRGIQAGAEFCGIKIDYSSGKEETKDPNSDDEELIDEREEKRVMQEIKLFIQKRFVNEGLHIEKEFDTVVQSEMNEATTTVIDKCLPSGLIKSFPRNNMSAMVLTGAKGGKINRSQIACLLGQQALEGKRVPRMPNGKTLPSFSAFDPDPRSSGYISDRFITGLRPQDFYFHCMAGREGLIDTAVKTARSGYLQRCLIKQLESLVVSYDMTVRDNDGSVVQFLYGEDSIDVTEMLYLNKFDFMEQNHAALLKKYYSDNFMASLDTKTVQKVRKEQKAKKQQGDVVDDDPILSIYNPAKYLGSTSEKMYSDLKTFCKKYKKESRDPSIVKTGANRMKTSTIEKLYYLKYLKSLVAPGENVGTLAGQGIGEPSTQMTLNTFHLAGHGGANVTLGIPRLREILMTASENLKTPLMVLPLRGDKEFTDEEISNFANKFQKLQLSEVINNVKVSRDYILKGKSNVISKYEVFFEFEDLEKIKETFGVTKTDLTKVFTSKFLPLLIKNIQKQTKRGIEDTMAVKDTKSKHMKEKEQMEDEEVLEEYQDDGKKKASDNGSEIDQLGDTEGIEAERLKKKTTQVEGYDEDVNEEASASEASEKSGHQFADQDMEIEGLEEISESKPKSSKIDLSKLSNFRPYLQHFNFIKQESEPEPKRAKIHIILHLAMDSKSRLSKILMLSLIEAILQKVLIRSVKGINKSYVVERKIKSGTIKEKVIMTEGINFDECYSNSDVFDLSRLETNDINQMIKHYGIEAGRYSIVKEIKSVFDVYGIEVDYRHLSLVADFMTQQGNYRPFNRIGMQDSNSPFLKASFETSTSFLSDACTKQDLDDNTTPSASIVLGQIPKIGTGVFDLLHDHTMK